MGAIPFTYGRPAYVEKTTSRDSSSALAAGIPLALSFEKIVDGGTCPPCTVRDFMNYLLYVERSAENLQFYLWHRDYVERFKTATTPDMALSPMWTQAMENEAIARVVKEDAELRRQALKNGVFVGVFKGTDFEDRLAHNAASLRGDSFLVPLATRSRDGDRSRAAPSFNAATYRSRALEAYIAAGAEPPFTIQPFRAEIDRLVTTYIMDGAPRQLNLSARERKTLLRALAQTTHPSTFRSVAHSIEAVLRRQAHPNFIRWSIGNGNPARVAFARGLGLGLILIGIVVALVLILSRAGRGWRAFAAIALVPGIATLTAAQKGMCVVLHGLHHRQVRPWELFAAGDTEGESDGAATCGRGGVASKESFDSFGSANSYEDAPWVLRYQQRSLLRKIFDREVLIREPVLRQIQDVIFLQSVLCALLVAGVLTAGFVAMPGGNFF